MVMFKSTRILFAAAFLAAAGFWLTAPSTALAAGDGPEIAHQKWAHGGPFGAYDDATLRRGLQVYREVCAACHSLDLVAFRTLSDIGMTEDEIKELAAEYEVTDGPDDEGEMFDRPGLPFDYFVGPYANEKAGRAANNGSFPPDLSLITKARPGGEDLLYAILTGYEEAPKIST